MKASKDVMKTWRWLLIGLVQVVILTILWIYLLQHIAVVMVWISIIGLISLNATGFYYSFQHYKSFNPAVTESKLQEIHNRMDSINPQTRFRSANYVTELSDVDKIALRYIEFSNDHTEVKLELDLFAMLVDSLNSYINNETFWKWVTIILGTTLSILLLLVCCLCSRIRLACAVIKESGKAVMQMKSTLIFPIVPFCLHILSWVGAVTAIIIISAATQPSYRFPNGTLCTEPYISKSVKNFAFFKFCFELLILKCFIFFRIILLLSISHEHLTLHEPHLLIFQESKIISVIPLKMFVFTIKSHMIENSYMVLMA